VHKAQRGTLVQYIGGLIEWTRTLIQATIQADRVEELTALTIEFLGSNVISKRQLRSYVGNCESFASLLFM
jgi:hypothetical protein